MSINTNALIFGVQLQDFLVDKEGLALSDGVIYFYSNVSRTTLKNVYYQTGTVAPYQYLPLPNPLTLSAAGTIVDVGGTDSLIGYYPLSEADNTTPETYFIQVFDRFGTLIFTRYNFPILPGGGIEPILNVPTLQNLVMNGRFWRNIGNATITSVVSTVVSPDQHDGYSVGIGAISGTTLAPIMSDMTFNKDGGTATDTITFQKFPLAVTPALINDPMPEFYIEHTSTAGSGETYKFYQIPINLHLRNLAGSPLCGSIQGIDNSGTGLGKITLSLFPFQGTGQTSVAPTPFETFDLTSTWNKYIFSTIIPEDNGYIVDNGPGDDALYLWIGLQTDTAIDISFALPSLYLGTQIPTTSFLNYDQIETIINSPRTGDVRTSLNYFFNYGWVPMNDGSIGNASSSATTRANIDTWPLFNLLWANVSNTYAPVSGGRGSSAIADFNANKTIALTAALGRAFIGTAMGSVALGTIAGASTQTLTIPNIPAHTHPALSGQFVDVIEAGGTFAGVAGASLIAAATTGSTGSGSAFSIVQPSTYMNFYIKL